MKLLSFHYHLKIDLDAPVSDHRFTLRFMPSPDARQRIVQLQRYVFPSDFLSEGQDQWGNTLVYGCCRSPHTGFEANACGQAVVGMADCVPDTHPSRADIFRLETPLTKADAALEAFAEGLRLPGADALSQAEHVMAAVHQALRYQPGTTGVSTSAAQSFAMGCGVCQDFSHVMLSALRHQGIPARYVVGMLLGEGKSHAWVEVLYRGNWYAFDPTNQLIVTDQHIKLSHGRDYRDCTINRGIFRGSAFQNTDISVIVTEIS